MSEPSDRYDQAIEDIASWVERCWRGDFGERAGIAARLRLGVWRSDPPRKRLGDLPKHRAYAEAQIRSNQLRAERAAAAKAAWESGAEPLHGSDGLPRHHAQKSFGMAVEALGFGGGNPDATRIYERHPSGDTHVLNGAGELVEVWHQGRRPRRNNRLAGHSLGARYSHTKCPKGCQGHPTCSCGVRAATETAAKKRDGTPVIWHSYMNKTDERRWHNAHKDDIRQGMSVFPPLRAVSVLAGDPR